MSASNRVWLITGCSSGFGRELVLAALNAGDRVMATARDVAQLDDLVSAGTDRIATARLDVTDQASIDQAVAETIETFGRIDVLVNNAGYGLAGAVEELDLADLRALMDVIYFGSISMCRAVLPQMRAQGGGAIVQMSSMVGRMGVAGFGAYSSAKFALEGISESLAMEVGPLGIRVMIVEPGAFRTGFAGHRMGVSTAMPVYAEVLGQTSEALRQMDGNQAGDPAKAAQRIVEVVGREDQPLRLVLGNDAIEAIRMVGQAATAELDRMEPITRSTDFD